MSRGALSVVLRELSPLGLDNPGQLTQPHSGEQRKIGPPGQLCGTQGIDQRHFDGGRLPREQAGLGTEEEGDVVFGSVLLLVQKAHQLKGGGRINS